MTEKDYQEWMRNARSGHIQYVETYVQTLSINDAWEAFLEDYRKGPSYKKDPNRTYKWNLHNKCWPYICFKLDKCVLIPTKSWIIEKWMRIVENHKNRGEEMAALKELAKLIEAVDDQMKIQLQVPEKIEIHFTDDENKPEEKI